VGADKGKVPKSKSDAGPAANAAPAPLNIVTSVVAVPAGGPVPQTYAQIIASKSANNTPAATPVGTNKTTGSKVTAVATDKQSSTASGVTKPVLVVQTEPKQSKAPNTTVAAASGTKPAAKAVARVVNISDDEKEAHSSDDDEDSDGRGRKAAAGRDRFESDASEYETDGPGMSDDEDHAPVDSDDEKRAKSKRTAALAAKSGANSKPVAAAPASKGAAASNSSNQKSSTNGNSGSATKKQPASGASKASTGGSRPKKSDEDGGADLVSPDELDLLNVN